MSEIQRPLITIIISCSRVYVSYLFGVLSLRWRMRRNLLFNLSLYFSLYSTSALKRGMTAGFIFDFPSSSLSVNRVWNESSEMGESDILLEYGPLYVLLAGNPLREPWTLADQIWPEGKPCLATCCLIHGFPLWDLMSALSSSYHKLAYTSLKIVSA